MMVPAKPIDGMTMDRRNASIHRLALILLCCGWLAACANWPVPTRSMHLGQAGIAGACADLFVELDRQTSDSRAVDAAYQRIAGFPYLRVDRFLASFRGEAGDPEKFMAWLNHLQALDQSARRLEIGNLSDSDLAAMGWEGSRDALFKRIVECSDQLKKKDFNDATNRDRLHRDAVAEDEYIALRRAVGIYPLTKVFVERGVRRWHSEARQTFSPMPPEKWRAIRYASTVAADTKAAERTIRGADHDILGIPAYAVEERNILFAAYAPLWEVETVTNDDRIGSPNWLTGGKINIDTDQPVTFTHLSFTRSGRTVFTQLNYIIWFPSRPKTDVLDIYGGLLDGVNYRVTLDKIGKPILYETIHNCGCYYKAYPSKLLQVRETIAYEEPPLILKAPPIDHEQQTMVVALESRTHYVHHLYAISRGSDIDTTAYFLRNYDRLRSLHLPSGNRRSMFDRYGLVPGTERLERHILWPTGVVSPGGMRQWGKHAVAFVGKRHFDDPFYMDMMFRMDEFQKP